MFEVGGNGRNSKLSYRIMHVYAGGSIPASSSADAPPPPTTAPTYVGLVEDAKGATLHLGSIGKISYYKKKAVSSRQLATTFIMITAGLQGLHTEAMI